MKNFQFIDVSPEVKRQCHFFTKRGEKEVPHKIYDEAIFLWIKASYPMFILNKEIYLYQKGIYRLDEDGATLKDIIARCIYPMLITSNVIKRVYERFFCDSGLRKTIFELNCYPDYWINFQNGFWDCKEKKFVEHDPKYLAINQVPHVYNPNANLRGERIEKYFSGLFKESDDREMILQYAGYCLTKDTHQQRFLIITGSGGSGKSILLGLMRALVGAENTSSVSLEDFQQRFSTIALVGKLLNSCGDVATGVLEDTKTLKKAVGEDPIRTEQKNHPSFDFQSYAKLLFSANELPIVREKTNAFYRRLLVFRMDKMPQAINPNLLEELLTEIDYLLKISVEAVQRMYENLLIAESKYSKKAVAQLWEDNDSTQAFLMANCERTDKEKDKIDKGELFKKYLKFCEEYERQPLTKSNFYKSVKLKGIQDIKTGGYWYFKGITYKETSLETSPNDFAKIPKHEQLKIPFS